MYIISMYYDGFQLFFKTIKHTKEFLEFFRLILLTDFLFLFLFVLNIFVNTDNRVFPMIIKLIYTYKTNI